MNFVILIIRLTTWEHQDLLLLGQAILLDHRVVDMTAIHTTPAGCPHESVGPLNIQEQVFDHQPLTTPAVHDMASSCFAGESFLKKNSVRRVWAEDQKVLPRKRGFTQAKT
jgi:hypothetical protein